MTVLLTGTTGRVGYEVARILRHSNVPTLHLVRDPARVPKDLDIDQHLVVGDLTKPESYQNDPRLKKVMFVINCAGCTDFNSQRELRAMHHGSLNLATWFKGISPGRFTQLSACYSAPMVPGSEVFEGDVSKEPPFSHYHGDKRILEDKLTQLLGNQLCVIRAPALVGTTRAGCANGHYDFFWMFQVAAKLGVFPIKLTAQVDTAPLDSAALVVKELTLKPERLKHTVYHVSQGKQAPTVKEIIESFAGKGATRDFVTADVPEELLREVYELDDTDVKRFYKLLKAYQPMLDQSLVFNSERLLQETGKRWAQSLTQYAELCHRSLKDTTLSTQLRTQVR